MLTVVLSGVHWAAARISVHDCCCFPPPGVNLQLGSETDFLNQWDKETTDVIESLRESLSTMPGPSGRPMSVKHLSLFARGGGSSIVAARDIARMGTSFHRKTPATSQGTNVQDSNVYSMEPRRSS